MREYAIALRVIGLLPTVSVAFTVSEDTVTVHRILHNGQSWLPDD